MTAGHILAVVLATVGAVLFGLAAVRQHGAVQATMADHQGLRQTVHAFWRLIRDPSWLLGAIQGVLAGGVHVIALALAPITLVQPIGVVAVPVTVVAAAVRTRRRPSRAQVLGSSLSVGGIGALTVLLLAPEAHPVSLPSWRVIAGTALVAVAITVLASVARRWRWPLLRCVTLAVLAAALFGFNSVLIRLIGHVAHADLATAAAPVLLVAVLGLALALPVGLWAMQSAYLSGSPHVVICCLTLVDPISAVLGGHLLLRDGVAVGGLTLLAAVACASVAAVGVLLLSMDYPVEVPSGE